DVRFCRSPLDCIVRMGAGRRLKERRAAAACGCGNVCQRGCRQIGTAAEVARVTEPGLIDFGWGKSPGMAQIDILLPPGKTFASPVWQVALRRNRESLIDKVAAFDLLVGRQL